MTETRDFDRLARAWLDLMPDEAPDRVIDAVLQAVETVPQARRPIGVAVRRSFQMNRFSLAALAAALVVLAGGALVLSRFPATGVGGPSPSPSGSVPASPPGSSAAADLPASLQGSWFGSAKAVLNGDQEAGSLLQLRPESVTVAQANNTQLTVQAAVAALVSGRLQVESGPTARFGCQASDLGSYAVSLSAGGRTLTIGDGRDSCAARLAVLQGTWWLSDCRAAPDACLGEMDAGAHASQYIRPDLAPTATYTPRFGALTYTVPNGWANDADWPGNLSLSPFADYQVTSAQNSDPAARVVVLANVSPESLAMPCSGAIQPGIGATPAAVVGWLRGLSQLQASTPISLTVDGHPALAVDLQVPIAPTATCDGGPAAVEYLVSRGWGGSTGYAVGLLAGERDRLIVLDVDGNLTAIVVHVHDASRFDAFVAQAMPIVQSFHFQ